MLRRDTFSAMNDIRQRVTLTTPGFEAVCVLPLIPPAGIDAHLTGGEAEILDTLSSPKRRVSFVMGRIAARRCVRELIEVEEDAGPALRDIEIGRDRDGRPTVVVRDNRDTDVRVSISHGGEYAVAAAVRGGGIGVDVEPVTEKAYRLRERIASTSELDLICSASDSEADTNANVTRLFSAKESMAKCLGTHLFHALHWYRLVKREDEALILRDDADKSVYRVLTAIYDQHVFTLLRTAD